MSEEVPDLAKSSADQVIIETAVILSLVEVGLGAIVHGFKIPLGGHFLSLNQGFFLTRLVKKMKAVEGVRRVPFYVSSVSALLKSLSPAGNKLGPMLSISAQGILFSLPLFFLGANIVAVLLGMVLLSVWAFLQPFLTLYLFFGHSLIEAFNFYLEKMQSAFGVQPQLVLQVLFVAVATKAFLSLMVGWIGYTKTEQQLSRWDAKILALHKGSLASTQRKKVQGVWRGVFYDLTRPLFLFSLALMAVFFYFSERDVAQTIWLSLRPLGIATLFFYICRRPGLNRLADNLEKRNFFRRFIGIFRATLSRLQPASSHPTSGTGISCLVLAAGQSKRMGKDNKLLLPIAGKSFVRRSVEQVLKYPFQEIVVVTGFEAESIHRELRFTGAEELKFTHNERHSSGMHSSIRAGLLALVEPPEGCMICLSDQPRLSSNIIRELAEKFLQSRGPRIVYPLSQQQKGHPVFISQHFFDEILAEPDGDYGCSYLFKRYPQYLQAFPVNDPDVLVDVDTPEDYKACLEGQ